MANPFLREICGVDRSRGQLRLKPLTAVNLQYFGEQCNRPFPELQCVVCDLFGGSLRKSSFPVQSYLRRRREVELGCGFGVGGGLLRGQGESPGGEARGLRALRLRLPVQRRAQTALTQRLHRRRVKRRSLRRKNSQLTKLLGEYPTLTCEERTLNQHSCWKFFVRIPHLDLRRNKSQSTQLLEVCK